MEKKEFQLLPLLICVAIPLVPGFLVGVLTSGQTDLYATIRIPGFAPPAALFPIVWGILYALMGISLYLIYQNGGSRENYVLFGAQLVANLLWPFLFFSLEAFWISFVWLLGLWVLILLMILSFYRTYPSEPLAAYLQIPYFLWVTFAGILNLSIAVLN